MILIDEISKRRKPDLGLRSITLVGDEWTGELAVILADIQAAFDGFTERKREFIGSLEA